MAIVYNVIYNIYIMTGFMKMSITSDFTMLFSYILRLFNLIAEFYDNTRHKKKSSCKFKHFSFFLHPTAYVV